MTRGARRTMLSSQLSSCGATATAPKKASTNSLAWRRRLSSSSASLCRWCGQRVRPRYRSPGAARVLGARITAVYRRAALTYRCLLGVRRRGAVARRGRQARWQRRGRVPGAVHPRGHLQRTV